jgi:hypothetical protein
MPKEIYKITLPLEEVELRMQVMQNVGAPYMYFTMESEPNVEEGEQVDIAILDSDVVISSVVVSKSPPFHKLSKKEQIEIKEEKEDSKKMVFEQFSDLIGDDPEDISKFEDIVDDILTPTSEDWFVILDLI